MSEPKHVVGLSGGKDSTALAFWLVENEPRDYEFICNETGNELPEMLEHWERLERLLGSKLVRVRHTKDLAGMIEDEKAIPNWRQRFCTRILKIEPTIKYMEALPDDSVLYVGLRADEEARRGIFGEDMNIRFPLREQGWTEADVWAYLAKLGISIPSRTDCALCFYQRIDEWQKLYLHHPDKWKEGEQIEAQQGHTFRSPGRDTWPAGMKELGEAFASGRQVRKSAPRQCPGRVCSL